MQQQTSSSGDEVKASFQDEIHRLQNLVNTRLHQEERIDAPLQEKNNMLPRINNHQELKLQDEDLPTKQMEQIEDDKTASPPKFQVQLQEVEKAMTHIERGVRKISDHGYRGELTPNSPKSFQEELAKLGILAKKHQMHAESQSHKNPNVTYTNENSLNDLMYESREKFKEEDSDKSDGMIQLQEAMKTVKMQVAELQRLATHITLTQSTGLSAGQTSEDSQEVGRLRSQLFRISKKKDEEINSLQIELRHLQRTKDALETFCHSLWKEMSLMKRLIKKKQSGGEDMNRVLEEKDRQMQQEANDSFVIQQHVTSTQDIAQDRNLIEENKQLKEEREWLLAELGRTRSLLNASSEGKRIDIENRMTPDHGDGRRKSAGAVEKSRCGGMAIKSVREKVSHMERRIEGNRRHSLGDAATNRVVGSEQRPMSSSHRRSLLRARLSLLEDLDVCGVTDILVQEECLPLEVAQDILAERTNRAKRAAFLDILPTRGDHAYHVFNDALHTVRQPWLAEKLSTK